MSSIFNRSSFAMDRNVSFNQSNVANISGYDVSVGVVLPELDVSISNNDLFQRFLYIVYSHHI